MVSVGIDPGNLSVALAPPDRLMPTEPMQPMQATPPPSGIAGPRPSYVSARTVGAYLPKLTRKAFETFGFSTATLVTDWSTIVGDQIAGYAVPERIKWPRGAGATDGAEPETRGRSGATLVLRVDPARALDLEYKRQQILERINAYFGYRSVAELRLLQAPVTASSKPAPEPPCEVKPCEAPELVGIADERLRSALLRLKQGLMTRVR
jgi:hypothetical protein